MLDFLSATAQIEAERKEEEERRTYFKVSSIIRWDESI